MCGRFALHHPAAQVVEQFAVEQVLSELRPRYNIAPSQPVAIVRQQEQRTLSSCKWGLVPFWAKDPRIGSRMINARAETIGEKPAYRNALKRRRCLVPASGFYEWKQEGKTRTPTYVYLRDVPLMALAGLWEEWQAPEGEVLHTCTIITTQANEFMAPIHTRMPVIFTPAQQELWLDPAQQDLGELVGLLQPFAPEAMLAHAVGKQVNTPAFDDPACIERVEEI